ncbi:MAG TPA: 3-oxoacyl-ACP reductase family protein [Stellaceae bacterium]|nr:3-oxoacyl-ACP reductase family protein [Stellaceae bacterium]
MDLRLTGKVALVTGGANGVGRAICLALSTEGTAVAVNYRSSAEQAQAVVAEIAGNGGKAIAIGADVSQLDQVKAMVARVVAEFGRLDILVNNAGVAQRQRFAQTMPEDWRRQIDTCLYGTIHCCHEASMHLEKSGAGRIVSLIGDSSRVGESGLSIVAAARAGVIGLTKSLAREMGRFGVTANVVSLGLVETAHDRDWVEANRDKLVQLYPLRRLGQPEDVAPLVALLASEHGGWITGQVISVSGGYSMV